MLPYSLRTIKREKLVDIKQVPLGTSEGVSTLWRKIVSFQDERRWSRWHSRPRVEKKSKEWSADQEIVLDFANTDWRSPLYRRLHRLTIFSKESVTTRMRPARFKWRARNATFHCAIERWSTDNVAKFFYYALMEALPRSIQSYLESYVFDERSKNDPIEYLQMVEEGLYPGESAFWIVYSPCPSPLCE